ncbi:DUF3299 domain-containing protein [Oceanomicrobium pacificus]|uniref:DUF3299 domain-containing protein n=1 Tax=Oceanomicrobium pacificus TaxID=2692916 RepID=A0A6B0TX40_9RHOB|nr:DUF3299 domain-containing protein [Oceanomicrobium pacificus]MXU66058.1 DUF3299 domain-containing protein [Oceanomicrobium pacificus]
MTTWKRLKVSSFFVFALAISISVPLCLTKANASDQRNLGWADLVPEVEMGSNPFEDLDYRQKNDLVTLYRIEVTDAESANDFARSQASKIRAKLVSSGLDPDWLFAERERLMKAHERRFSAPNPEVLSQNVRVPGYILPLEMDGRFVIEFLLVPTVGACVHTPPPAANQLIHVHYPDGYPIRGMYDPVWIMGELQAERQTELVTYSDGQRNVESAYVMTPQRIEQYR